MRCEKGSQPIGFTILTGIKSTSIPLFWHQATQVFHFFATQDILSIYALQPVAAIACFESACYADGATRRKFNF
jgi:hypothetical protein